MTSYNRDTVYSDFIMGGKAGKDKADAAFLERRQSSRTLIAEPKLLSGLYPIFGHPK